MGHLQGERGCHVALLARVAGSPVRTPVTLGSGPTVNFDSNASLKAPHSEALGVRTPPVYLGIRCGLSRVLASSAVLAVFSTSAQRLEPICPVFAVGPVLRTGPGTQQVAQGEWRARRGPISL